MPAKYEVIKTRVPDMTDGGSKFSIISTTDAFEPSTASTKPAVEGSGGNTGFTFIVANINKRPKEIMNLIGTILNHYRGRYPDGVNTINGQTIPSTPSDLLPWTSSIWTNYGEKKFPFIQEPNWDIIISDVAQEREIDQDRVLSAISYFKIETPFVRFGFEPRDGIVNNLSVATVISDTSGFVNLVASLTEDIPIERIKEFFENLTLNKED